MEYAAIILFAIVSCVTPGPNNAMIMASGLNYGIRRSLPHYFGICLGFPVMVVAVGLGLAGLFELYPALHTVLKVIGAAYLSYLAWKIASAPVSNMNRSGGKPFSFIQAAGFQWVNPKAWALAVGATVAYTVSDSTYALQVVIIAIIFFMFGAPCIMLWLWFGSTLKSVLQNPDHVRLFNVTMALLLIASLIPVFIELFTEFSS